MRPFHVLTLALTTAGATCTPAPIDAPGDPEPDWWEQGVCYEIFVRSFADSDGDGVGDLQGLIDRLDYVGDGSPDTTDDLGASCIWLMPTAESPSYHGYDVADYYAVDSEYGTEDDFRRLVDAAHERDIRVVIDMVINHASREHPAFLEATSDPASPYREWFRFADEPGPDNEFGDNNWHPTPDGSEYYFGFFSSHMPDLNWESDAVRDEFTEIARYWLQDIGVDGLRLDAIRHLMDEGAVTTNVPATNRALADYQAAVKAARPDAWTVGEVFDSTAVLEAYYPDQMDSFFAFQVANGILSAVRDAAAEPLHAAVLEMQDVAPGNHRWSPFLRNHDQTRTMTELGGDIERARLAASILLTLPGTPFVYYGEEIGMSGDKPDPRLRTPMQWTGEEGAGFTTGSVWEPLQSDSATANVAVQTRDPRSLLNHYREMIHLRAHTPALGASGTYRALETQPGILGYVREKDGEQVLVVANLVGAGRIGVVVRFGEGVLGPGSFGLHPLIGIDEVRGTSPDEGFVDVVLPGVLPARTAHVYAIVPEGTP